MEAKRAAVRAAGGGKRAFRDGWSGPGAVGAGWAEGKAAAWVDWSLCAPDPAFVVDGFSLSDVVQGALGDCYFLAALADVAGHDPAGPGAVLDSLFVTAEPNPEGVYCIRLWVKGVWKHYFMDSLLPARANDHLDPCCEQPGTVWAGPPSPAAGTYHPLVAAKSACINEFWPAMLEKAWAMMHGSYAAIEGSRLKGDHFPLNSFFPHSEGFRVDVADARDAAGGEAQWAQLRDWAGRGWLMTCGSKKAAGVVQEGADAEGIVRNHAFSVMAVLPPPPIAPQLKLLQLRNPHGRTEWNGAYSNGDLTAWTPALRAAAGGYKPEEEGNHGLFWMPFEALEQKFDSINITPQVLFAHEGGDWHKAVFWGGWCVTAEDGGRVGGWVEEKLRSPQLLLRSTAPATFTVRLEAGGEGEEVGGVIGMSAFTHRGGDGAAPAKRSDFYFTPPGSPVVEATPVVSVDSCFEPVAEGALQLRRGEGEGGRGVVNSITGREGCVGVAVRLEDPGAGSLCILPYTRPGGRVRFTVTVLCREQFTLRVAEPGRGGSSEEGVEVLSRVA